MKETLQQLFYLVCLYGLLSFWNWSLTPADWGSFSNFVMGFFIVSFIIDKFDKKFG